MPDYPIWSIALVSINPAIMTCIQKGYHTSICLVSIYGNKKIIIGNLPETAGKLTLQGSGITDCQNKRPIPNIA